MLRMLPTHTEAGEGVGATVTVPQAPAMNPLNEVMPDPVMALPPGEELGYDHEASYFANFMAEASAPFCRSPAR